MKYAPYIILDFLVLVIGAALIADLIGIKSAFTDISPLIFLIQGPVTIAAVARLVRCHQRNATNHRNAAELFSLLWLSANSIAWLLIVVITLYFVIFIW